MVPILVSEPQMEDGTDHKGHQQKHHAYRNCMHHIIIALHVVGNMAWATENGFAELKVMTWGGGGGGEGDKEPYSPTVMLFNIIMRALGIIKFWVLSRAMDTVIFHLGGPLDENNLSSKEHAEMWQFQLILQFIGHNYFRMFHIGISFHPVEQWRSQD